MLDKPLLNQNLMRISDELFGIKLGQVLFHLQYVIGDNVYYKRRTDDYWKGPATVIGQENQQVLIKHGST